MHSVWIRNHFGLLIETNERANAHFRLRAKKLNCGAKWAIATFITYQNSDIWTLDTANLLIISIVCSQVDWFTMIHVLSCWYVIWAHRVRLYRLIKCLYKVQTGQLYLLSLFFYFWTNINSTHSFDYLNILVSNESILLLKFSRKLFDWLILIKRNDIMKLLWFKAYEIMPKKNQ